MEDLDNIKLMSRRPNIATLSGLRFDYLEPTVGMIHIGDVAAGLSKCCRFAGQCRGWYSVARHSVRVSLRVEREARRLGLPELTIVLLAFKALFHDGSEFATCDAPSPWKKVLYSIWKPVELAITKVIYQAFNLDLGIDADPIPRIVHDADTFIYLCEWHDIMNVEKIKDWYYPGDRPSLLDEPTCDNGASWEEDYVLFMDRFNDLSRRREAASAVRAH